MLQEDKESRRMTLLDSESALRGLYEPAMGLSLAKQRPKLDRHTRNFIAKSPFLCIATSGAKGQADISPRGDPAGFVQIIDDETIAIPDRPGNNRLDTMVNITENPEVALIFFIPGIEDTLRIAGRATIERDEMVLKAAIVSGKVPKVAIVVRVREVFFHCAKALKRSHLWNPAKFVARSEMPSLGRIILDQTSSGGVCESETEVAEADKIVEENYKNELY
jgi:uncharacterized protein